MTSSRVDHTITDADHLFRHESGNIIAWLCKRFGYEFLEDAEDIVQETIVAALQQWSFDKPKNPKAWLYRVARNKAVDHFRKRKNLTVGLNAWGEEYADNAKPYEDEEFIQDAQLKMMLLASDPALKPKASIAFILKTLCGFSVEEIAKAFLSTNDSIEKRLYRSRKRLREVNFDPNAPLSEQEANTRLETLATCLYLMFNEGYYSESGEDLIRKDLCLEAMRLCKMVIDVFKPKPKGFTSLMALMCFHSSRFEARRGDDGSIILFPDQDRSKWNKELIAIGTYYLSLRQR